MTTVQPSGGPPTATIAGRYQLQDLVGRGGTAEVWAAEDNALGRRVALKLVTASGGEDAGRVGDEARLLAGLSHPGLVPVYDAGTDDRGRPWVVMELVVGETLADAVERGPLRSTRVGEIGGTLADALSYVHRQGLIHRDVKPANVLLGQDGRVRLTDFGIARLVDAAKVTATGLTVGTASYLSPEQVLGDGIGPASDVYSLGLVLLECLTGKREYPGTAIEVALARLNRQPAVPRTLGAGWPALLESMTAKEPADRPTTEQVARELRRVAEGGEATRLVPTAPPEGRTTVLPRSRPADGTRVVPVAVREQRYERPYDERPARPLPPRTTAVRPLPPRPVPVPPRSNTGWVYAAVLVGLIALAAVVFVVLGSRSSSPAPGLTPVDQNVPAQIRRDLQQLLNESQS